MSGPGIVTLSSLRFQAQERSDQINSSFLSTSEWNRNIMGSYKELYDLLIAAYGEDYYATEPLVFPSNGTKSFYPLPDGTTTFTSGVTGLTVTPPAFYKLLGVDLILGGMSQTNATSSAVTIRRFNFSDRNRYAVPNFQSFYGVTNLRIRIHGNDLWVTPVASQGQFIQIWQVPRPTDLQPEVICGTTISSTTVTCTDTSNLAVGMYVQAAGNLLLFASGTTISSITPNTSFVVSNSAAATTINTLLRCWSESTTIDGVSGWEEYVVVDAALKAMGKEESDVSVLMSQKQAMVKRLQDMAENRDIGNPATVGDTQSSDFWQPPGAGSGWGGF
jgi:hypothetical protein